MLNILFLILGISIVVGLALDVELQLNNRIKIRKIERQIKKNK